MYIVEINVYVLCFPSPSAQRSVLSLACDAMAVYARECPTEPRGLNLAAIYAEEGSLFNTSQRLLESALESVKGDYFFHYFLLGIYHVANMLVNFNILRCKHACSYQTENVSLIWQKYSTEYSETVFLQCFLQTTRKLNHRGKAKQFTARCSQKLFCIV